MYRDDNTGKRCSISSIILYTNKMGVAAYNVTYTLCLIPLLCSMLYTLIQQSLYVHLRTYIGAIPASRYIPSMRRAVIVPHLCKRNTCSIYPVAYEISSKQVNIDCTMLCMPHVHNVLTKSWKPLFMAIYQSSICKYIVCGAGLIYT